MATQFGRVLNGVLPRSATDPANVVGAAVGHTERAKLRLGLFDPLAFPDVDQRRPHGDAVSDGLDDVGFRLAVRASMTGDRFVFLGLVAVVRRRQGHATLSQHRPQIRPNMN